MHPLRLKIDPGSQTTGIALVDDASGEVVFAAELTHRGPAIKHALDQRRAVRRGSRQRNTRYRPPRFQNRRRKAGWLPPSLESRVANVHTWVKRLASLCPLGAISVELVKFDLQRMEQPEISGVAVPAGDAVGLRGARISAGEVGAGLQLLWDHRGAAAGGTYPGESQRGNGSRQQPLPGLRALQSGQRDAGYPRVSGGQTGSAGTHPGAGQGAAQGCGSGQQHALGPL